MDRKTRAESYSWKCRTAVTMCGKLWSPEATGDQFCCLLPPTLKRLATPFLIKRNSGVKDLSCFPMGASVLSEQSEPTDLSRPGQEGSDLVGKDFSSNPARGFCSTCHGTPVTIDITPFFPASLFPYLGACATIPMRS
jgi:hypothetical protein